MSTPNQDVRTLFRNEFFEVLLEGVDFYRPMQNFGKRLTDR
jgi:hypothetical protein